MENEKPSNQPADADAANQPGDDSGISDKGNPKVFTPEFVAAIKADAAKTFAHYLIEHSAGIVDAPDEVALNEKEFVSLLKVFAALQITKFCKRIDNPINEQIQNLDLWFASAANLLIALYPLVADLSPDTENLVGQAIEKFVAGFCEYDNLQFEVDRATRKITLKMPDAAGAKL